MAVLCFLKFIAAIGAIAAHLPLTEKYIPAFHLGGFVPCLDATPWVAESAALGLVILTASVDIYMSRKGTWYKHQKLTGVATLH